MINPYALASSLTFDSIVLGKQKFFSTTSLIFFSSCDTAPKAIETTTEQLADSVFDDHSYSNLKEIVKNFYERVIVKFFEKIQEWLSKGITYALDILGLELDGSVSLDTPSW